MKSLMLLWQKVADDLATKCSTCATMDFKTVQVRSEHEGISFLTITLPVFGKSFEQSLERGSVDRSLFQGFAWKGGLPRFLGGFLDRVFDRGSGELLDEPCIDAIQAVRQLTLMFGKINLPCTDVRERKAMHDYVQCEHDVRDVSGRLPANDIADFRRISSMLFGRVFHEMDQQIHHTELVPKHGPGATADGLRGNAKYHQMRWPRRLEKVLPIGSFLLPSPSFEEWEASIDVVEPRDEVPVKVISVPKTLKTPRIIGIEPTAMQYAQQAVLPVLLRSLAKDSFLANALGFDDQAPNQEMAREGSLTGLLATLDLSEASDRVSNRLVKEMFREHPQINELVQACRSRSADVPGHGNIPLAKFASMGSALTFPVEAMVFLTVIFIGIERALNSPLSWIEGRKAFDQRVRVYGDDIIVPVSYVLSVVDALHSFGFVVNVGKSFWNGKFRESCGKEYYAGEDVSIVRVREMFPSQRQHASETISLISLRNQLYYAGLWGTVRWLDERIRKLLKHFPTVLPSSPVQGRHSFLGYYPERFGDALHDPQVRGYVVQATPPSDLLEEGGALLKCFLNHSEMPIADKKHLERAGRPQSTNLKLRWASAV